MLRRRQMEQARLGQLFCQPGRRAASFAPSLGLLRCLMCANLPCNVFISSLQAQPCFRPHLAGRRGLAAAFQARPSCIVTHCTPALNLLQFASWPPLTRQCCCVTSAPRAGPSSSSTHSGARPQVGLGGREGVAPRQAAGITPMGAPPGGRGQPCACLPPSSWLPQQHAACLMHEEPEARPPHTGCRACRGQRGCLPAHGLLEPVPLCQPGRHGAAALRLRRHRGEEAVCADLGARQGMGRAASAPSKAWGGTNGQRPTPAALSWFPCKRACTCQAAPSSAPCLSVI